MPITSEQFHTDLRFKGLPADAQALFVGAADEAAAWDAVSQRFYRTPDGWQPFSIDLDERSRAVYRAVEAAYPWNETEPDQNAWVERIYDDKVIVRRGETLLEIPYSVNANGAAELGDAVEVVQKPVEYQPVQMSAEDQAQARRFLASLKQLQTVGFSRCEAYVRALAEGGVAFNVEREAKLFEAGDYPDKGLTVTVQDLDRLIANHASTDPIPIKVEHTDTPFDGALGVVKSLYRRGKELFGRLVFTDAAWALIKDLPARALSVGILTDKSALQEVSLVNDPRVADARVFAADTVGFTAQIDWGNESPDTPREVTDIMEQRNSNAPVETVDTPEMSAAEAIAVIQQFKANSTEARMLMEAVRDMTEFSETGRRELSEVAAQVKAATAELQRAAADNLIAEFKRQGKILPAAEPFARAILDHKPLRAASADPAGLITFTVRDGDEEKQSTAHFADVFVAFLEAMAPAVNFREIAKAEETDEIPPAVLEMFRKGGVDPHTEIAKRVLAEMRR